MGKGKSIKRRAANEYRAKHGNLALAQLGKGSANLPLPQAPTPKELEDKMPASLRRMLAMKKALEAPGGTKKQQQKRWQRQQEQRVSAAGEQAADEDGPSTSGRQGSECGQPQQPQPLPPQLQRDAFSAAFEAPKKLKQRKKDYLNAKKLKKKGKHISKLEEQHERDMLKDNVKFGERVDAPLQAHLKRKNWDAAAHQDAASKRCKEVFVRQMQQASNTAARMQAAAAAAAASGGGKRQLPAPAPAPAGQEQEELRQAVIDAYRSKRKHAAPSVGQATLGSLARLVQGP